MPSSERFYESLLGVLGKLQLVTSFVASYLRSLQQIFNLTKVPVVISKFVDMNRYIFEKGH